MKSKSFQYTFSYLADLNTFFFLGGGGGEIARNVAMCMRVRRFRHLFLLASNFL